MPLYQKKPTIVEAIQSGVSANYGSLGALVTEDWILKSYAGTLITMNNDDFEDKYTPAPSSSVLVGDDID
jgi:hypothetical protein